MMKTFVKTLLHFNFILLLLWISGIYVTHASLVYKKSTDSDVGSRKYKADAWDVIERSLQPQPQPSNEPMNTQNPTEFLSLTGELGPEESPDTFGDMLSFPALTTEPMISPESTLSPDCVGVDLFEETDAPLCEPEFGFEKSYENEVTKEPPVDSDLIIIQSKDRPRISNVTFARALFASSFRYPICVIRRKQMKCFIRKRCGFFRKNDRRVTSRSIGPTFNWSRNRRCSSKCGFKAGRNCVSG